MNYPHPSMASFLILLSLFILLLVLLFLLLSGPRAKD